jgi:hypothetical protein
LCHHEIIGRVKQLSLCISQLELIINTLQGVSIAGREDTGEDEEGVKQPVKNQ